MARVVAFVVINLGFSFGVASLGEDQIKNMESIVQVAEQSIVRRLASPEVSMHAECMPCPGYRMQHHMH